MEIIVGEYACEKAAKAGNAIASGEHAAVSKMRLLASVAGAALSYGGPATG